MQKNKTRPLSHSMYKHLKMDLTIRSESIKKENMRKKLVDTGRGNDFLSMIPKAQAANTQMGLHQMENHLHNERNHQQCDDLQHCRDYL